MSIGLQKRIVGSWVTARPRLLQRKCACGQHSMEGQCDECKKQHSTLQRRSAGTGVQSAVPPVVHQVLRSPGRPLDTTTRGFMESRFGQDFSQVRVHTDAKACESARAVNALAYTVGRHMVFASPIKTGADPATRKLIAHELTHVVQQSTKGYSLSGPAHAELESLRYGDTNTSFEREAEASAERVGSGGSQVSAVGPSSLQLQRAPDDGPGAEVHPGRPLPYREATELSECIKIMGAKNLEFCRKQALGAGARHRQPGQPVAQRGDSPAKDQGDTAKKDGKQKPEDVRPPADLRARVRQWLKQSNFKLPLVADPASIPDGKRHVFYGNPSTLDAVTNDVTDVLGQVMPGIRRSDVWSEVWQYYNELRVEAEKDRWQTVVQVLYTPQITFATSQPQTPGAPSSPLQHSLQISGGRNFRLHSAGASGPELTFQGNLSLFSLTGGHEETGRDAFQNFLVSAQLQQVWNLGREFRIGSEWAVVQASLFGQLAGGIGGSYAGEGKDRKLYVGFLAQPSLGGQVNLNIAWFQVIVQGSVVYSYLSPTTKSGSSSQQAGAVQFGLGLGAQF